MNPYYDSLEYLKSFICDPLENIFGSTKYKDMNTHQNFIQYFQGELSDDEAYQLSITNSQNINIIEKGPSNTCLAEALVKLLRQIPDHKFSVLNLVSENESILILNNELRTYHKEQPHYNLMDNATKKEISSNYEGNEHLPPDLIQIFLKKYVPNESIILITRTYIIDNNNYDVTHKSIGNGPYIKGMYILLTSSIEYGNMTFGERKGGHFELIVSNMDFKELINILEMNCDIWSLREMYNF
jgi:hypothetical protein